MSNKYSCVYSNLEDYNSSQSASKMSQTGIRAPMVAGTPSMRVQIIPVYGGMSYEALTHDGRCTCGGHFSIQNAYPNYGNNCTKFGPRACADNMD